MKTVTFDSTEKPTDSIVVTARECGWDVAFVTVTYREVENTDFYVDLKKFGKVSEIAVWDESKWDEARWANEISSNMLSHILSIISNGSFPKTRSQLTDGQLHQLRDAMILEAHANAQREVFVTGDIKAYIKNSRRENLQDLLNTRIVSSSEFELELHRSAGGV